MQNISNENLIELIFEYEKKIHSKKYSYPIEREDVIYEYLNGECEFLVNILYTHNNKKGKKIELKDEELLGGMYHYIYKCEEGYYYDINGKFLTIEDLIIKTELFEDFQNIEIKEIPYEEKHNRHLELYKKDLNLIYQFD